MNRPEELTNRFLEELDKHIADIVSGRKDVFYEIQDFAEILCIHPVHLSNTIRRVTGKSPCHLCESKLAVIAKDLLQNTDWPVSKIAARLTYDAPGFSRFFKRYAAQTPTQFRQSLLTQAQSS